MSAVLPLLGGLLLGRYVANRPTAVAIEAALFVVSAALLVATAPSHGDTRGKGVVLALVVALLSAATFAAGTRWQRHSLTTA